MLCSGCDGCCVFCLYCDAWSCRCSCMGSVSVSQCCVLCVSLLMDLFVLCVACLTVVVNCLVKQFTICLGVVVILLLNVMAVFSVGGGALLDKPCMVFQRMCMLCL